MKQNKKNMRVLIASSALFELSVFCRLLIQEGSTVIFTEDLETLTDFLSKGVVDAIIGDEKNLTTMRTIISSFPMVNYAVISSKNKESFHQATEGLGVFMQLPPIPEKNDGLVFIEKIKKLNLLTVN